MTLSTAHGLALVRMGAGLYFLVSAAGKTPSWVISGATLAQQLQHGLPRSEAVYRPFIEHVVLPNAMLFARLVTLGEWAVGLGLLFGLLTQLGALAGMALTLNYMLLKGLTSTDGSIDRLLFLALTVFLVTSAGLVWGLDGTLRDRFGQAGLAGYLGRSHPLRRRVGHRHETPSGFGGVRATIYSVTDGGRSRLREDSDSRSRSTASRRRLTT